MNAMRRKIFGLVLVGTLVAGGTTLAAQDLPRAGELDEMDVADDGEDAEELDEAFEEAVDSSEPEAEPSEEGDEEADEEVERADDWETSLRDPIAPIVSTQGSIGFHGISSAVSPGPLAFQVGLLAAASGGSDMIRLNDQHRSLAANVVVNASFNEFVGAHFGLAARNNINTFGRPQSMLAQGDMTFGGIARYPVSDGVWLGGDLSFYMPSGFDSVGLTPRATSVRPQAILSLEIDEMMGAEPDRYVPLVLHANLGYRVDNSENLLPEGMTPDRVERYAYGLSAYNMFEMGLGAEFPLPHITPFLGWTLGIPNRASEGTCDADRALECTSEVGGSSFPQQLSLGGKAEPVENLGLHLGFDFSLTGEQAEGLPATLPYNVHFGVSWQIDPAARQVEIVETEVEKEIEVEPPRGRLFGQIVDQQTGEPVAGARISYVDFHYSSQMSSEQTGVFESYGFAPGEEVQIELQHPAYEPTFATWHVEDEGTEELEFQMEPLPREATVRGTVTAADGDADAGAGLAQALVLIVADDGSTYETRTDAQGQFQTEITAGGATVAAVVDGYLTAGEYIQPDADSSVDVQLALSEVDEWLAQRSRNQIGVDETVYFEDEGAVLMERSLELMDHVAGVIMENPDVISVHIQGHTDDAGDDNELLALSQERADAVRDALIERGISPERLDAEGFGATSPLLPNTSSRNRSLNRRVEFHISTE